jgi:membrane associated rhomboid family serine protease
MFPIRDSIRASRAPVVTIAIIAVSVIVFGWQVSQGPDMDLAVMRYALVPGRLVASFAGHGAPVVQLSTIFTSMFLHGDVLHLFGNMWFLWIFGDNVEDRLGRLGFLGFYLTCGVAAAASQVLMDPTTAVPMVGASGAIAGVLGAYMRLYPSARVLAVLPIFILYFIEVRAVVFLGLWFVLQVVSSFYGEGGVAWWAHIAGFATGLALSFLAPRRAVLYRPTDPRLRRQRYR